MNAIKYILLIIIFISSVYAQKDTVTLQFQWKHQFQFAGYYMAKEKGFYDDVNLNVKFLEYSNNENVLNNVLTQKINYATGRSSLINKRSHGKKIVLLNALLQSSPLAFVSHKQNNIETLGDFKTKRLTVTQNEIDTTLYPMLLSQNMNKEDFNIYQSTNKIDDFINKKTDVISLYTSNQEYTLIQKGIKYNIFHPRDYGFDFYDDILYTSEKETIEHKQRTIDFNQSSLKGWKYAFENIEETVDVILKNYNTQNKTRDALLYEAKVLKQLAYKDTDSLGIINKNKIQRSYEAYHIMGLTKSKINLDNFIFNSTATKANTNISNIYTQEEKNYLQKHKVIKMCNNPTAEPIEFAEFGNMNRMAGIAIDTIRKIEKDLDIKFQTIHTKSWKESQRYLKEKECDILPAATYTEERAKYANFTQAYLNLPIAIFTTKNKPFVSGLDDIADKTWARRQGGSLIDKIQKKYPNTKLVITKNIKESIQLVNNGDVYFTLATLPVASTILSKYQFDNIQIAGYYTKNHKLSIAIRKDKEILRNILDKALTNISSKEHRNILQYWTNKDNSPVSFIFLRNVFIVLFALVLLLVYRQYLLKKTNSNLKDLVDEKTHELQELNLNLELRIKKAISENTEKDKLLNSQSKMASMGEMIGNIAHQWRQPLSVISTGVTGMQLQKEYDLLDNEQFNKTCNMINENAQYLSKTIDDFKNYIKGTQNKDIFNISQSIHTFLHLVEGSIKENNIDVILHLDDEIEILGYKNELVQCFLNIYNNAKDALKENQNEKRILIISAQIIEGKLIISFQDNAKGIKKSIIDKVFEPYFTTKYKSQGTGLGLHMTYKLIVDSMQGKITVVNQSFKNEKQSYYGANFKIILPLKKT